MLYEQYELRGTESGKDIESFYSGRRTQGSRFVIPYKDQRTVDKRGAGEGIEGNDTASVKTTQYRRPDNASGSDGYGRAAEAHGREAQTR